MPVLGRPFVDDQLAFAAFSSADAAARAERPDLLGFRLGWLQFRLLASLRREGAAVCQALQQRIGATEAAAVRAVHGLEGAGFVTTSPPAAGWREAVAALTASGARLVVPDGAAVLQHCLSPTRIALLQFGLMDLTGRMAE
jgi:DNA-binding MarR family transcriptional regulator